MTSRGRGPAWALVAGFMVVAGGNRAAAQTSGPREETLGRIVGVIPTLVGRLLEHGHTEFFRLLENLELFHFESEIDRYVGPPRTLHDATNYKLRLLPFEVRYPVYRQLIGQLTRLDSVRSRPIYTVTPDSVSLTDIRIRPFNTLEEFLGQGSGAEVRQSLFNHFSARELADLTVFALAQQPFFPDTDEGWDRIKRRIARASVPFVLGALATGAAFDAGALNHSGPLYGRADSFQLRYYGGFRSLGFALHPLLRAGLAVRSPQLEVAAGVADQIQPGHSQADSVAELALRSGWLNNRDHPAGLDAFFETALRRAMYEPAGFIGDRTTARVGFFFRRQQPPWLPDLDLRGSAEAESNLEDRLHIAAALGFEPPRAGVATMVQGSLVPTSLTTASIHEARLNVFLVGTMEPVTAAFEEDMAAAARQVEREWEELERLDARHAAWERALRIGPPAARTGPQAVVLLAELERLLNQREERVLTLANALSAYLTSRQSAYEILGWPAATDELHGPLDASLLLAARTRILTRIHELAGELAAALGPLMSLKKDLQSAEDERRRLSSLEPGSAQSVAQVRIVSELAGRWEREAERVRATLATRDTLRPQAARILEATGGSDHDLRSWDDLDAMVRMRLCRLTSSTP